MGGRQATLEISGVSYRYGATNAVSELDLALTNGELAALIGPNGSGKSTALKLGCGILKPTCGEVRLWGKPIGEFKGFDRAKLISYMPQMINVSAPFRVNELVEMGRYPYSIGSAHTVDEALELVGLIEKRRAYLAELSGGELRRAFIAMMLVQGAGVLLLDEPLANLDIKYQVELIRILGEIVAAGEFSVLMALHDLNTVRHFESVSVIKNGSLHSRGTPEAILTAGLIEEVFEVDANDVFICGKDG